MVFGHRAEREGLIVFRADEPAEHAPVLEREGAEFVIGGDDGARVHDVFQQVIEVRASAAGEVRAEVRTGLAEVEERVAGGAGLGEKRAAFCNVGLCQNVGSQRGFQRGDAAFFVVGRGADFAPDFREEGGNCGVAERGDLAGVVGGEVFAGDFSSADGGEQRLRENGA